MAGGGGGMTAGTWRCDKPLADWWKLRMRKMMPIYSEKSVYSLKGVSALGIIG